MKRRSIPAVIITTTSVCAPGGSFRLEAPIPSDCVLWWSTSCWGLSSKVCFLFTIKCIYSEFSYLLLASLYFISLSWLKYIQNVAIGNKYISQILYYFAVAVLYLNISIYCCFILLLTFSGQTFNFLLHYLYLKTLVSIVTLQIAFLQSNKSFN